MGIERKRSLVVMMSDEELNTVKAAAIVAGVTVSTFVRQTLAEAIEAKHAKKNEEEEQ